MLTNPSTRTAPQSASSAGEERRLIEGVLVKERKATAQFVDLCSDWIYGFVRHRLMPRAELVEDVMQETLFAAWQALPNFRAEASLRSWVLGIARHKVEDYYRKRICETDLPEDQSRKYVCDSNPPLCGARCPEPNSAGWPLRESSVKPARPRTVSPALRLRPVRRGASNDAARTHRSSRCKDPRTEQSPYAPSPAHLQSNASLRRRLTHSGAQSWLRGS